MQYLKRLISAIVLIFASLPYSTIADTDREYIRVSEFIAANPTQHQVMSDFSKWVRNDPVPTTHKESVKIAVIYPGVQSSDYWRRSLKAFTTRMDLLNITYELKTYFSRPGFDSRLQAEQLASAINWQPDYMIFSADALNHKTAIQRILLKGKPKLILQNITTPHKAWLKHPPFMYTGFDHEIGTKILADEILQTPKSRYALLYFSPGYVSQMRGDTFVREARQHPSHEQVSSFYTGGDRKKSRIATEKALEQHSDLNMIFACSTDIALGVIDVLEEKQLLDQVTVNGWGGGADEIDALLKGKLDLTVMRINDDASIAMAEAIKLDIQGHTGQVPKIFSGDIVLLNENTTLEEINRYKNKAFRYSGL